MIRGAKKQIIEVLNTENEYFEKAILVVSAEYSEMGKSKLDKYAKQYISEINWSQIADEKTAKKKSNRVSRLLCALKYFAVSGAGAAITYFIVR